MFIRASLAISIPAALLALTACFGLASGGHQTAYVTTPLNGGVLAFTISNNTGTLSQILGSPYRTGISPTAVYAHPSGKFAYISNAGEADISLFQVDSRGALTEVTPRTPTGSNPSSLAMDAAGTLLFVTNAGSNTVSSYAINSSTGALTAGPSAQTGFNPVGMAVSPSGKFLYVANLNSASITGYSVDSSGGLTSMGSAVPVGSGPNWVTIDPSGKFLYVASLLAGNFSGFTVDSGSGALTAMSGSPYGVIVSTVVNPLSSVITDSSGKYLYVASLNGNNVYAFNIDPKTGVPTTISGSPFPAGTGPIFLARDVTGAFLFAGNEKSGDVTTFRITPTNGVLTSIATTSTMSAPTSMSVMK